MISYICDMRKYKDTSYFITEDGKVWSDKTNKFLKTYKRDNGYLSVSLGRGVVKLVHRLVAETYLPNPSGLPEVDHLDANKSNNHVNNLEWVTHEENMERANMNGLLGKNQDPKGSRNGMSRLDEMIVAYIRQQYATGKYNQKRLAKVFGVNQQSISNIVNNKSWRHL